MWCQISLKVLAIAHETRVSVTECTALQGMRVVDLCSDLWFRRETRNRTGATLCLTVAFPRTYQASNVIVIEEEVSVRTPKQHFTPG